MASSCEFKTTEASTKSWLRTRNIIDKYLNILDLNAFRKNNTILSERAREKYGITGRLFSEANDGTKAVPNKQAFKTIDNAKGFFYQEETVPASTATKETIDQITKVAEKMGVKIKSLADYAKENPDFETTNIAGVADLAKGVIAIATGREDVTLTEEVVHIATAMIEQTNPALITQLISKIDKFKIYKLVLAEYGKRKDYQLPNGKPDIRKIKKEAVDKLITETIINENKDANQFPELMEEENISMIRQWWNTILDYIRGMYYSTNLDLFKEVGKQIINGDFKTVLDLDSKELFLQIEPDPLVDKIYNTFMDYNNRMKLNPKTPTDKRHYTFDGERVAKSVTEKIKSDLKLDRNEEEKFSDEQKRMWGDNVHKFIQNYIENNLIDENGYAREQFGETYIASDLDPAVVEKLQKFSEDLIRSYKPGTRFLIEKMAINENVKGKLASTLDFVAIEPVVTKDGKPDVKVDILDWKTMQINKSLTDDVPWQKQKEWKEQMGEYVKIAKLYGVKDSQIRRSRMVPFQANYKNRIPGQAKSGLVMESIEIGTLNSIFETNLYLLPVPSNSESTGNEAIDSLLKSLRAQWEKLFRSKITEEGYGLNKDQIDRLSKAIRSLHLKLDFAPLSDIGITFLKNAKNIIDSFKDIDYEALTADEINKKLGDLISIEASANKYIDIDQIFLSEYNKEELDKTDIATLKSLESIAASSERMIKEIEKLRADFSKWIAVKSGFLTEETAEEITRPEKQVDAISKAVLEPSTLGPKIVKLMTKLNMESKRLSKVKLRNLTEEYKKLLLDLDVAAKAAGKTPFEMIGTIDNGNLSLIKKIDKKFWADKKVAEAEKNTRFFIDNMDFQEYKKLMKEFVDKSFKQIEDSQLSSDPEIDYKQKEYKKTKLLDNVDITRTTFNGFQSFEFNMLFNKTMKDELHLSEEYKNLEKNDAAFRMWSFFTRMNRMAKDMGFLDSRDGMAFFPLIEATYLQKFASSQNWVEESKDFFNDLYRVRAEERAQYSKIDPETKQLKRETPRPFTFTDKEAHQLSTDLGKVGVMYMSALLEYQAIKDNENVILTLAAVEKAKGGLITDSKGDVLMEGGKPQVDDKTNKNYVIAEKIVDDYIYGIKEDQDSFGNVKIGQVTSKLTKSEEKKEQYELSSKKTIEFLNTWTQLLAVGLKPLVALPNYIGANAQAYINAGNFYRFREFEKNNLLITANEVGGKILTTEAKALLNMFIPLNEDVSVDLQREIAKERGFLNWISTWKFQDVMMSTNSYPDRLIQFASAKSFLDNSMVVDGKIVNIRQQLKKEDSKKKYGMSFEERRALEKSFEKRVQDLKDSKSLEKIIVVDETGAKIPGVTDEEIARYSVKITEFTRNVTGQMSVDNKAQYRRDALLRGFSMFKNWIVRQVSVRGLDIQKNAQLEEWEYGRVRAFMKAWIQGCNWNILRIKDIIVGNENGLKILNDLLVEKREAYFKATGQELTITEEEFYDMMRTQIQNEVKELQLLFGLLAMMLLVKAAAPDDDDDDLTKNRYKWVAKLVNKASDELSFYYLPTSFESVTKGSLIPSLGILSRSLKVVKQVGTEAYGRAVDDQEIIDKTYPTKYFLDVIPVASQFQREVLPYIDPELAKEMGIRVTAESRQGQ